MKNKQPASVLAFILLLGILLPLEVICARLSYETLGEILPGFYYLILILLNIIPVILFILRKRIAAMILVFMIGVLIVPWQLQLGYRLLLLKEESANLVNYAYEYKEVHGEFPKTNSTYQFKNPGLKKFIQYSYTDHDSSFQVTYWVGTKTTSHFYRPELKCWNYYPD